MLVIRHAQTQVFAMADRARFERSMMDMVLAHYPDEVAAQCGSAADLPAVQGRVRDCIARAEGHGLDDEADIERFVELCFEYGAGFEDQGELAWAGDMLKTPGISGSERMHRIEDRLAGDA